MAQIKPHVATGEGGSVSRSGSAEAPVAVSKPNKPKLFLWEDGAWDDMGDYDSDDLEHDGKAASFEETPSISFSLVIG